MRDNCNEAGVQEMNYSKIMEYFQREKDTIEIYSKENSLVCYYNFRADSIDVISRMGRWKIVINKKDKKLWLYHKNENRVMQKSAVSGYHHQTAHSSNILGYLKYIVNHDEFKCKNDIHSYLVHGDTRKGPRKRKKYKKRSSRMNNKQRARFYNDVVYNEGNIAY